MVSLDGTERTDFDGFEVTQASAAMLEDFLAIREGQQTNLDLVLQGLQRFNDLKFRRKAGDIKRRMTELGEGHQDFAEVKKQCDGLLKNVKEDKAQAAVVTK